MLIKKRNKGFTLIELIISIAISAIVLLIIISIINSASHGYKKASEEVSLQMEAQLSLGQLNNLALQAKSVKEIEVSNTEVEKRYIIEGSTECHVIILAKRERKLYLLTTEAEQAALVPYDEKEHLLAEYVKDIRMEPEANQSIRMVLTLSLGDKETTITKKVKLRIAN